MKKLFFIFAALFAALTINAQGKAGASSGTIIAEVDFTGVSEFTGWSQFGDDQEGSVVTTSDGLAITVGTLTGQLWQPQVMVIPDGSFDLEEGGNYKVVVTAKFPTSGTLQINMGSWSANDQNVFPVTATGDFQEVECLFEDWSVDAEGAHLLFQCGDFLGTTILKRVQVIDLSGSSTNINSIIDNIYYKLNTIDKTATVTMNPSGYNGNIVIPETVKYEGEKYAVVKINDNAFSGCTNLTGVTIPYGVTSIGNNAFNSCEGLTSITIPNSVTNIGNYAFSYCYGITSVTIPNSVKVIGEGAFEACSGLTSITIPNSVTSIAACTFEDCSSLTSVTIPTSVTSIGDYAFGWCYNLLSITIPNSVTSIGRYAFIDCYSLLSIKIPSSVKNIGEWALAYCSGLTSIKIPSSVTSIGAAVLAGCSNLTSISVEAGNSNYDSRNNCNAIIDTKTNNLIAGCNNTIIPNGVVSIGEYAFYNCSGLTSIEIPSSVKNIGYYAFGYCNGLTSITIPNSVTSIGSAVLAGCRGLTSITVEAGNPNYDSRNNCNAIIDSKSNTLISGCMNTIIPSDIACIGNNAFSYCYNLKSVDIPNSVTIIEDNAFYSCSGLTSLTIPNSVTNIGYSAFRYCSSLLSVTIPNSLTSLGNYAFAYCSNLTSIVSEKEEPFPINNTVFRSYSNNDVYATVSLIVPKGTKSVYLSTEGWSQFQNIMEFGEGGMIGQVFEYDGISYKIGENNTVSVTSGNGRYAGDVVIPSQVTFNGSTYSVTGIGEQAFYSCRGLISVTIPSSVTSIGQSAFQYCYNLTSVSIPNSVTSIEEYAFFNCYNLTSITIPNSVASLSEYVFGYCSGLTSIIIPDNVTSIGQSAFTGCGGLASITIPNSITSIGEFAFSYCYGLTSIISEINNPFEISDNVFYNYNDLYANATLIVPTGARSAYQSAEGWNLFQNIVEYGEGGVVGHRFEADGIYYIIGEKYTAYVTSGNVPYSGDVVIPSQVPYNGVTYSVTGIGEFAFNYTTNLTSVTIPNSVTSIGYDAFYGCTDLTSVTIPASVTSIGDGAFAYCSGLTSIAVEDGNTKYDSRGNCNAVIDSKSNELISGCMNSFIPNSVTNIRSYAFAGISGLTSITIPRSVKSIDNWAFSSTGLTSITIPNSVDYIGGGVFSYCSDLTSIVVEDGNKVYDSRGNCNAIIDSKTEELIAGCKSTIIPNNIKSIGNHAFSGCSGLTSIELPNSLTNIGYYAFESCSGLTSIDIPNSVTNIRGGAFSSCVGLTSFIIPSRVTNIEYNTFYNCDGLTSIEIPNNVTSIDEWAFCDCNGLTSVEIPSSVTNIGRNAFAYCRALKNVYCMAETVPVTEYDVFWECNTQNATLFVPSGCVQEYRSVDPWTTFGSILETGRADVNCDGKVDDQDRKDIVNHIMGDTPAIFNKIAADLNGDKKVNAADVVLIINMIK